MRERDGDRPAAGAGDLVGPPDVARHPGAALVDGPLAVAQPGVPPDAADAVVRQEDDDRVLGQLLVVDRLEEPGEVAVDVLDHAVGVGDVLGVELLRVPRLADLREPLRRQVELLVRGREPLRHLERRVRGVVRDVGEERLARLGLGDEFDRRVGEHVGAVALRLHLLAVPRQHGVEVRGLRVHLRRVGRLGEPAAVAPERLAEPAVLRPQRVVVAEVPLAEQAGPVAGRGEQLRQRGHVRPHHRPAGGRVHDPGAVVVKAGQQARPRGRADRRDVEVLQPHRLFGEGVEVRRPDDRVAVGTEVAEPLVVGDHEQDVGAVRGRGGGPGAEQHERGE